MDFVKMHGVGNDYIFIESDGSINGKTLAIILTDRHYGIGGDGVVLYGLSNQADVFMRIYNVDGSEGNTCGNALRCVAKLWYEKNRERYKAINNKVTVSIKTLSGIRTATIELNGDTVGLIKVDMGVPKLLSEDIPVLIDKKVVVDYPLNISGAKYHMTSVNMGNPHAVLLCNNKLTDTAFYIAVDYINQSKMFPEGVNIEFVEIIDRGHINMRVYERGSGETMACGSGACAAVVALVLSGRVNDSVQVMMQGGELLIEYKQTVSMTGEAVEVFRGSFTC